MFGISKPVIHKGRMAYLIMVLVGVTIFGLYFYGKNNFYLVGTAVACFGYVLLSLLPWSLGYIDGKDR